MLNNVMCNLCSYFTLHNDGKLVNIITLHFHICVSSNKYNIDLREIGLCNWCLSLPRFTYIVNHLCNWCLSLPHFTYMVNRLCNWCLSLPRFTYMVNRLCIWCLSLPHFTYNYGELPT